MMQQVFLQQVAWGLSATADPCSVDVIIVKS